MLRKSIVGLAPEVQRLKSKTVGLAPYVQRLKILPPYL